VVSPLGRTRRRISGAATGKPISYSAIAIDRIIDRKAVEMWHVINTRESLRQIGTGTE
jgi:hypothetical protein